MLARAQVLMWVVGAEAICCAVRFGKMELLVEPGDTVAIDPGGSVADAGIEDGGEHIGVRATEGDGTGADGVEPGGRVVGHVHDGVGVAVHDEHGASGGIEGVEDGAAVAEDRERAVGRRLAGERVGVEVAAGAVVVTATREDDGVDA